MEAQRHTLFIQYRAKRAGAQTSLSRLATSSEMAVLNPVVLLAESGWLEETLLNASIPTYCSKWPSPRSLQARIGGLRNFGKKIVQQLAENNIHPTIVVANDHQECPVALAIAKLLNIPVISLLRSAGMTERDFIKYKCSEASNLFTVGSDLQNRVQKWGARPAQLYTEGFTEGELASQHSKLPKLFPKEVLVVGTSDPAKGFADLLQALKLIESNNPDFPPIKYVFTSQKPSDKEFAHLLSQPTRNSFTFIGRVNGLGEFARDFDFAIHPSRQETFGMAPIELMLAGVPTLSTETGILGSIDLPPSWLIPPSSPQLLATKLQLWYSQWQQEICHLMNIQGNLRQRFNIRDTSASLISEIKKHHPKSRSNI